MYELSVSKGPNQFNENGSYMTWQPNRPTSVRIQEMSRSASLAANTRKRNLFWLLEIVDFGISLQFTRARWPKNTPPFRLPAVFGLTSSLLSSINDNPLSSPPPPETSLVSSHFHLIFKTDREQVSTISGSRTYISFSGQKKRFRIRVIRPSLIYRSIDHEL
jgi:hypothetical protein